MSCVSGLSNHSWTNWAQVHTVRPRHFCTPESVDEVVAIVDAVRKKGGRLRVVGFGHSPSDIACCTDYMVSLARMNRVLSVDRATRRIVVEGGTLIRTLNEVLAGFGLSIPVQGSVAEPTIAGTICSGTHGTGVSWGILSTLVERLEIVTAGGELVECSRRRNAELFQAARCGFGCFGVIVRVELRCEEAFDIASDPEVVSLAAYTANLDQYATGSDYARALWYPHTDTVIHYTQRRVPPDPAERKEPSRWASLWAQFVDLYLFQFLLFLATRVPALLPAINRLYAVLDGYLFSPARRAPSNAVFNFDCKFMQHVSEWAIPIDRTAAALNQLRGLLADGNLKVHFPVEIRFTAADDIWLSPNYKRPACYLNIIAYRPYGIDPPGYRSYFDAFETLMVSLSGRPHWAKAFHVRAPFFRSTYEKWDEFWALQRKMDPAQMFVNEWVLRLLEDGPAPHAHTKTG